MEQAFCTEAEVKTILETLTGEDTPSVVVIKREQKSGSYMRKVTFLIRTVEGDEALVNAINKWSVNNDRKLEFVYSELNLQTGNLDVDYLFVAAYVAPNLA